MYREIAEYIYKLFVVNTYAAAIQQDDGKYVTKYFPLSSFVLEEMLKQGGSMGCYQQGYKNDRLKWICFDFDCSNKANPDVEGLLNNDVKPFLKCLDRNGIRYLVEFSGRRGIHVWVVFDTVLSKKTGYQIVEKLKRLGLQHIGEEVHIDYFPATDSSKGNKVGKQVKFPLSCHKAGGQSYFLDGFLLQENEVGTERFWKGQLEILRQYVPNSLPEVIKNLSIDVSAEKVIQYKYKKYVVLDQIEVTLNDVEQILSEVTVFKGIFERMKQGHAYRQDWTVLLGTLCCCDSNCDLVRNLFATFPNYDTNKTMTNIFKLRDSYFPATFGYLYHIYELPLEEGIDPEETGFHYLISRLGVEHKILEQYKAFNEKENVLKLKYTLNKEINYLMDNDEVPDIVIWNRLRNMKPYDLNLIEKKVKRILNGEKWEDAEPNDFVVYNRMESDVKTRKLVSLSAEDRVLTTHLALKLCELLKCNWHSYSYNVLLCSRNEIFYNWYSSWGNYIDQVKVFLEIPYMENYEVFVLDLKGFYDHIDFLAVYEALKGRLDVESERILTFLIAYNENLMRVIQQGKRQGVPQGPAYARIVAEQYIDYILQSIFDKFDRKEFKVYRYVDDIIVYCAPGFKGQALYDEMRRTLAMFGLPINQEKSEYLGRIGDLKEEERQKILHKDKFSYDLQDNDFDGRLFMHERQRRIQNFLLKNSFEIGQVSYVFGGKTLPEAAEVYYARYSDLIFLSQIGRGSSFKRFYKYLFTHEKMLEDALEKGEFLTIPVNSLSFMNCIHVLYFLIREQSIDWKFVRRLQQEFLVCIQDKVEDERTRSVIKALLYMGEDE